MYKIPKVIGKLLKFVEAIIGNRKFSSHHYMNKHKHTHTHTNTLIINKYTYHLVIYIQY